MKPSYPAGRVTHLVGLKELSVYMKPSYPASVKHIVERAKLHNCVNKSTQDCLHGTIVNSPIVEIPALFDEISAR